ncbi:MAG: tRNA pseudouridine(55) synthase TruB [Proteobacteria bacterium]|nr:tRNA pseudouridine(55) synthase TruB [Pseudomonadota bacterium]
MIHGWIIVDKPLGMSSAHVVAQIKRLFKIKKAGHGGTLDPLATGVLPIAIGEATKTLSYVLDGKKAYRFEVKWGEARSTDDQEGEITATSDKKPTAEEIQKSLPYFRGTIEQTPPAYSALKINGKRAYALAREGKEVILKSRFVTIDHLTLIKTTFDSAVFEVQCSKGTYVRSLARDLAVHMGTYGHIISLRRLMAGPFLEQNAILLDSLLKIGHKTELMKHVLPLQEALADILALEVQDIEAVKLRQGQTIPVTLQEKEDVVLVLCRGVPQALAKAGEGKITPLRVFNIEER